LRNIFSTPDEAIFQGRANDNLELLKAWAGTTLAYAIYTTGSQNIIRNLPGLLQNLLIAAVVCGLGFVLHELAHRAVARRYGAQAHFVANVQWLLISIVIALIPFGFFIAAPGAVWHRGYLTDRQGGLIALAGPATNLALSLLFLLSFPFVLWALQPQDQGTLNLLIRLFATGVGLNAFLGLFNMIPAGPFDGAKVLAWSPLYFGITVVVGILLTFVVSSNVGFIWQTVLGLLGV
jgi:Zn-dependent protease